MIEPAVMRCDVCNLVIPRGAPYCKLPVVIPADLRATIVEEMRSGVLKDDMPPSLRLLGLDREDFAPKNWECDVCYGCIFGFLPQLREAMRVQIPRYLAMRKDAAERAALTAAEP